MHALIVAQQWEPEEGAPQRRWAWLTKALIASGHTVTVITPPPNYPTGKFESTDPKVQPGVIAQGNYGETIWRTQLQEHGKSLLSRIYSQAKNGIYGFATARKAFTECPPDIILTTAPPLAAAFSAGFLAFMKRKPIIIDLRDVWPDLIKYLNKWNDTARDRTPISFIKSALVATFARGAGMALQAVLHNASGIVTTAPSFAELLDRRGCPQTLSVRNLGWTRGTVLEEPEETPGELNVLYAGTIGRAQGLHNALRAATRVKDAGVNLNLRFVGSGAHLEALRKIAKDRDLSAEFTGRIGYDEVVEHYKWADTVLIQLEDWATLEFTVPSKLYEALELGRHISLAVNGESARIVEESGTGNTVPAMNPDALANMWIELAEDPSKLKVAGRGKQWLADRGTVEDNAQKFVRFVERSVWKAKNAN